MSEHIEFNYARTDNGGFTTTPALIASVEQHLARWQAANNAPRVYFEMTQNGFYKLAYSTRIAYTLPAFIKEDIEYEMNYKEPSGDWMDKLSAKEWQALSDVNEGYEYGDEWWDWE